MGRAVQILRGAQAGDGPERFRQPGGYTSHSSWRAPSSASSPWDQHVEDLLDAAYADRSSFWNTWVPADRPAMATYIASALVHAEDGNQVPFATRSTALDRVVGSARLYELERWDWSTVGTGAELPPRDSRFDRVSIGHTWLAPAVQRSPVDTAAKLLMLDQAFTRWGVRAVRFQTDARNQRSRAAINRIGGTLDGVLRSGRPAGDGSVRDSASYSMTADEWPGAPLRLKEHLARCPPAGGDGVHRPVGGPPTLHLCSRTSPPPSKVRSMPRSNGPGRPTPSSWSWSA